MAEKARASLLATDQKPDQVSVELTGSQKPPDVQTVQWADLDFSVNEKRILKSVSGHFKPGQLACILGPSGAGKSTLLNVLAGRQRTSGEGFKLTGSIEIGDTVVTPEQMKKRVAFVMQDEALMATATVRESLEFSAALRLPNKSPAERAADIDILMTSLGIEHCADTFIGSALMKGISGGERKRASVGIELITGPSMVLLDEPTSGLDSYAASELVKELKRLAQTGKVVACTIHQPSSEVFAMFDHVMCLRQGEMYFDGPNTQLLPILESAGQPCPQGYNAADWLLLTAQTLGDEDIAKVGKQCESHTLKNGDSQVKDLRDKGTSSFQGDPPLAEVPRAAFGKQVSCLVRREAQNFKRDKKSFGARMGMTFGQAILYALIFFGVAKSESALEGLTSDITECKGLVPTNLEAVAQCEVKWQQAVVGNLGNEFGAIVGIGIAAFFGSAQPLLLSFPLERPVFLREYSSNMYSVVSYFLAKTIVELGVTLGQNIALWLIVFFTLQFRAGIVGLLMLIGTTWLMAVSASSMALWVGCIVSTPSSAVQFAPAISVPQILFSGLFLKSKDLPIYLRWIQYICALKYAINLMCIIEFGNLALTGPNGQITDFGQQFLQSQDIDKDLWWLYVLILFFIFCGFRTLALIALKSKGKYVF